MRALSHYRGEVVERSVRRLWGGARGGCGEEREEVVGRSARRLWRGARGGCREEREEISQH